MWRVVDVINRGCDVVRCRHSRNPVPFRRLSPQTRMQMVFNITCLRSSNCPVKRWREDRRRSPTPQASYQG